MDLSRMEAERGVNDGDSILVFRSADSLPTSRPPAGKNVFAQLMSWVHPEQFRRCVLRYRGDDKVLSFSCWEPFLATAFAAAPALPRTITCRSRS